MREKILKPNFPFRPDWLPFYYGWVSLAVAIMGMLGSAPGQTIGFSVFTDSLMEASRLDRLTLCVAYFVGTMFSGFLIKSVGPFYDKKGGRYLMCLAAGGLGTMLLIFSGLGYFIELLVRQETPGILWVSVFVMSCGFFLVRFFGQGMLMLTSRNLIGKWFETDRGKVSAVAGISVAVGFSLVPALFLWLISNFGWENSYRYIAVFLLIVVILGWAFYRDNPEECGIKIDAYRKEVRVVGRDKGLKSRDKDLAAARRTMAFWVVCLSLAMQGLMITAISFHITDIGKNVGLDTVTVVGIFIPIAIVAGFLDIIAGWMADRWPLKYVIYLMLAGSTIGFMGVIYLGASAGYWLTVAGIGVANGCFGTLSTVAMPHYFGRKHLGETNGYLMFCMVLGSSIGPVYFAISGSLFQSYAPALFLAMGCTLLLFFMARLIKPMAD